MTLINYDTEWELEAAIRDALKADMTLASIVGDRIFGHVPSTAPAGGQTPTPYIVVGDETSVEWDTKTEVGEELTVTIHIWSTRPGRKETKIIQGHLKRLLHDQLIAVQGHTTVLARREYTDTSQDPDGLTMHGVARYRYILQGI